MVPIRIGMKKPERLITAMDSRGESLEVLMDEKEPGKFRVSYGYQNEPWCGDRQKQRIPVSQAHLLEEPPAFREEQVEKDYCTGNTIPISPLARTARPRTGIAQVVV